MRFPLSIILACVTQSLFAQITLKSLPNHDTSTRQTEKKGVHQDISPAMLPFWDDFSISQKIPDSLRIWGADTMRQWEFELSSDVFINSTLAINPPTFNVATFDGLKANGDSYSNDGDAVGLADQLVSTDIDLSSKSISDNIYFSFYWQAGGNVERPEEGDSLVLQFMNINSEWRSVWKMDGGEQLDETIFTQEVIQVTSEYLSDNFRFKFQSYGDLDGPFDAWHVDWIYLNEDRKNIDNGYLDRAFTSSLTSPFAPFNAVPVSQFNADNRFIKNQQVGVSNLDALDIFPIDVTYILRNTMDNSVLIADSDRAYPLLFALEIDTINLLLADSVPTNLKTVDFSSITAFDSVVLQTEIALKSSDATLDGTLVDLRINDTIRQNYILHDYYAFDDGTAEFAAGTNIRNGQVAVQFWVERPDTLTHIDFNFPNISPNQGGSTIILKILDDLTENGLLRSQQVTVTNNSARDAFNRYLLDRPVVVSDTFYVAYQQSVNDFLAIGFDRSNPEAAQHIFENIDGDWIQNVSLMGALMIRPVFKNGVELVSGHKTELQSGVYPNPTSGVFSILGEYEKIELLNLGGSVLFAQERRLSHDISKFERGLFLLKIHRNNAQEIKKIILK